MEQTHDGRRAHWESSSKVMDRMYRLGVVGYMLRIPLLDVSFGLADRHLGCMDEGVDTGHNYAGSGILEGFERALEVARAMGVTKVTSRAGCGAAHLAWSSAPEGDRSASPEEHTKAFSSRLATALGVPFEHIDHAKMKRPADYHIARVAWVDGTGIFDPRHDVDLPFGFTVSRRHFTPEYAEKEVAIAVKIALDPHHGFGELFTREKPFIVIPIGDPRNAEFSLATLERELHQFDGAHDGRVKVSGFTAPLS